MRLIGASFRGGRGSENVQVAISVLDWPRSLRPISPIGQLMLRSARGVGGTRPRVYAR